MKILNIDDMLEAANQSIMPDLYRHVEAVEKASSDLAEALAKHLKICSSDATWEGKEFGGTCATFWPSKKSQKCPQVIDDGDPSGDWGMPKKQRRSS